MSKKSTSSAGAWEEAFGGAISTSFTRFNTSKIKKLDTSKTLGDDLYITGKSLNFFEKDNEYRMRIFDIVTSKNFERVIITIILLSSIQLALSGPLNDPNSRIQKALYWIDFLTTIVFLIEAIMKIVALGFVNNGPPSYLRNPWNLVDFLIIMMSLISLSPLSNRLQVFKMFRILRALRLISRAEGLRIGLQALL